MIFDTDVLIWVQRGNVRAANLIEATEDRFISVQTYMELLQGAQDKQQHKFVKDFLAMFDFEIIPLSENIGHRASIYVEEYSLSCGLGAADALIAATATENNMPLASSNLKHFRPIKELDFRHFKP
jgi:predicted nucleic acid-binding protein